MFTKGFVFMALMATILLGACFRPAAGADPLPPKITVQLPDGTTFGPRVMAKAGCPCCDNCHCPGGSCDSCPSCAGCAPCAFAEPFKACAALRCSPEVCKRSDCEVGQCVIVRRVYFQPVVVVRFRHR